MKGDEAAGQPGASSGCLTAPLKPKDVGRQENAMSPETQEQRLAAKRLKMPRELADLHWHLEDELTLLHLSWNEYKALFATNPKCVDLLNATAPNFFLHFEELVWRETLLHLCRLTDPPQSKGKNTLTILRMPRMIDDVKLKRRVKKEVKAAEKATEFARDWRNRYIAHRSLEHAFNPQLKPLATASRADVEKALEALRHVMNSVSVHYEGYHHDFEGVIAAFTAPSAAEAHRRYAAELVHT